MVSIGPRKTKGYVCIMRKDELYQLGHPVKQQEPLPAYVFKHNLTATSKQKTSRFKLL